MKLRLILLALLLVFVCSATSFAAIIVENRTGAVKIYMPDGKQIVVQMNEPMPAIPDGATVTILGGCSVVSTTGKSGASVAIGTYTLQIKEDTKVNLCMLPDGTVNSTIVAGEALITRKVEAYENRTPPPAPGLEDLRGNERRDISPSR